ncbi:helix-turn-helix transcriptional regulator (plasmid) [Deinococcus aquaticus]|uniref:Helix-turn-helix transcriptional regulator n=1 Tax=Deinococcus aquaticus TaxID=328692 RepID=A0ABY7V661_9DEIO|nr:helix-turn-helix transcriptional regulator [Deinococcus aquaticus]WDA60555.1 helix-turn-helix transcriptional regulator [Deinococcus aquaticus]
MIGDRVREARSEQNLTLQALDERIEAVSGFSLSQPTLTRIEQGTRSVYDFEVVALCLALNVDARWLLGLIDAEES